MMARYCFFSRSSHHLDEEGDEFGDEWLGHHAKAAYYAFSSARPWIDRIPIETMAWGVRVTGRYGKEMLTYFPWMGIDSNAPVSTTSPLSTCPVA